MGHHFYRISCSWRRRNGFIVVGALLALLFGILPNVLYLGHWPLPGGQGHESIDTQEEAREHAAHCHLGPSDCSDSPSLGQSLLVPATVAFSLPESGLLPLIETPQELAFTTASPRIKKPP